MPLAEPDRLKLDGIVGQMEQNGENPDAISFVVEDFKGKYALPDLPPAEGPLMSAARSFASAILPAASTAVGAIGAGAVATPETVGFGTIPAAIAGGTAGGFVGKRLQHWVMGDRWFKENELQLESNRQANEIASGAGEIIPTLVSLAGGGGATKAIAARAAAGLEGEAAQLARVAATGRMGSRIAESGAAGAVLGGSQTGQALAEGQDVGIEQFADSMAKGALQFGPLGVIRHADTLAKALGYAVPQAAITTLSGAIYDSMVHGKDFDPAEVAKHAGADVIPFALFNAVSHGIQVAHSKMNRGAMQEAAPAAVRAPGEVPGEMLTELPTGPEENVAQRTSSTITGDADLQKESLSGMQNQPATGAADVFGLPSGIYPGMEATPKIGTLENTDPESNQTAAPARPDEGGGSQEASQRAQLRARLQGQGQTPEEALRSVPEPEIGNASRGLQQAAGSDVGLPGTSPGLSPVQSAAEIALADPKATMLDGAAEHAALAGAPAVSAEVEKISDQQRVDTFDQTLNPPTDEDSIRASKNLLPSTPEGTGGARPAGEGTDQGGQGGEIAVPRQEETITPKPNEKPKSEDNQPTPVRDGEQPEARSQQGGQKGTEPKPENAEVGALTFPEFEKQYRDAFAKMMSYGPDEVGSQHYADIMAKLADQQPDWVHQIEAKPPESTSKPEDRKEAPADAKEKGQKGKVSQGKRNGEDVPLSPEQTTGGEKPPVELPKLTQAARRVLSAAKKGGKTKDTTYLKSEDRDALTQHGLVFTQDAKGRFTANYTDELRAADLKRRLESPRVARRQPEESTIFQESHPIATMMNSVGGLMSKSTAKARGTDFWEKNKSLWDDTPSLSHPTHNAIYKEGGMLPDQMAQVLQDSGIGDGTVESLWKMIGDESKGAATRAKQERNQRASMAEGEKAAVQQTKDFKAETKEPRLDKTAVDSWDLNPGDTVWVDGEPMTVHDAGEGSDVILEDGTRFGKQLLETGEEIYVEKVDKASAIESPPTDTKTIEEPETTESVPTGSKSVEEPPETQPAKPSEREQKKSRIRELRPEIEELAEKGGLTKEEAERYKSLSAELNSLAFDIARPIDASRVRTPEERQSTLPTDVVVTARNDLMRDKDVYTAIIDSAIGVHFNADTAVDDVMSGKNPKVSPQEFYDAFDATREEMRKHYGDSVELFRAEGSQKEKSTQNWATTREYAEQFGDNIISKKIPIDDVLAVNVTGNGEYHEVIVGKKPESKLPATEIPPDGDPLIPEKDMPFNLVSETPAEKLEREAKELAAENQRKTQEKERSEKEMEARQGKLFEEPPPSLKPFASLKPQGPIMKGAMVEPAYVDVAIDRLPPEVKKLVRDSIDRGDLIITDTKSLEKDVPGLTAEEKAFVENNGPEGFFKDGKMVVLSDQIAVTKEDGSGMRALARVINHELFHDITRSVIDGNAEFKSAWEDLSQRIPESDLADLAKRYTHLADWQANPESKRSLIEEWGAEKWQQYQAGRMTEAESTLFEKFLDLIKRVWRHVMGGFNKAAPTDADLQAYFDSVAKARGGKRGAGESGLKATLPENQKQEDEQNAKRNADREKFIATHQLRGWGGATETERRDAITEFGRAYLERSLLPSVLAREAILYEGTGESTGVEADADGTIRFRTDFGRGMGALPRDSSPETVKRRITDTVDEEAIHIAEFMALREAWKRDGSNGSFVHFINDRAVEVVDDIVKTRSAFIADGRNADALAIDQALDASAMAYGHDFITSEGNIVDEIKSIPPAQKAEFVSEFIRHMIQLRRTGEITETGWQKVRGTVEKWLGMFADGLRRALGIVKSGDMGEVIKSRIAETERMLGEIEKKPDVGLKASLRTKEEGELLKGDKGDDPLPESGKDDAAWLARNPESAKKLQALVDEKAWDNGYRAVTQHGTHHDFTEFNRRHGIGGNDTFEFNQWGIWTSDDAARIYGPKVLSLYGKMESPKRFQTFDDWFKDYVSKAYPMFAPTDSIKDFQKDLREYTTVKGKRLSAGSSEYKKLLADFPGAEGYRDALKSEGHDGVIIEGDTVDGKLQTIRVFLESSQLKKSTPITRDDSGRIIPLSERFKLDKPDIRFSLKNPPETPEEEAAMVRRGDLTPAANDLINIRRKALGFDAFEKPETQEEADVLESVLRKWEDNPDYPKSVVDRLETSGEAPTTEDIAAILIRARDLENRIGKVERVLNDPKADEAEKAAANVSNQTLTEELDRTQRVQNLVGTEQARAFKFRQNLMASDYSMGGMVKRAVAAKGGESLTEAEHADIARLSQQLRDLQDKINEVGRKMDVEPAKDAVDTLKKILDTHIAGGKGYHGATDEKQADVEIKKQGWFERALNFLTGRERDLTDAIGADLKRIDILKQRIESVKAANKAKGIKASLKEVTEDFGAGMTLEQLEAELQKTHTRLKSNLEELHGIKTAKEPAAPKKVEDFTKADLTKASERERLRETLKKSRDAEPPPTDDQFKGIRDVLKEHAKKPLSAEEFAKKLAEHGVSAETARKMFDHAQGTDQKVPHKVLERLLRRFISLGDTDVNSLSNKISDWLKERGVNWSPEDVMRGISKYGQTTKPSQEYVKKTAREKRGEMLVLSQIETITNTLKSPKLTGLQRDKATQELRDLHKRRNDLMRKYGIESKTGANQFAGARDRAMTAMENRRQDLLKELSGLGVPRPDRAKVALGDKGDALRKEVQELDEYLKDLKGTPDLTADVWNERREKAAEKSIERMNEAIKNQKFVSDKSPSFEQSQKLTDLLKQRDDLRESFEQIRDADPKYQRAQEELADRRLTRAMQRSIDYWQDRIDNNKFVIPTKEAQELSKEQQDLQLQIERKKREFNDKKKKWQQANRTTMEKVQDWAVKLKRMFVLSSPISVGKLTAAALARAGNMSIEDMMGNPLSRIIPGIAEKGVLEGKSSLDMIAQAIAKAVSMSSKDIRDIWQTGHTDLDIAHSKKASHDDDWTGFFGKIHYILKSTVKRMGFELAMAKQIRVGQAEGVDVTDPAVLARYGAKAYEWANRQIFMQDNALTKSWNAMLGTLERNDMKPLATLGRVLLPIIKVPTNIVGEAFTYIGGVPMALANIAKAYKAGIENLTPEQADLIQRQLKKGSLGVGLVLMGFFNPAIAGGYYQHGQKRRDDEAQFGAFKIGDFNVPSWMTHTPFFEAIQFGSTLRRTADAKLSKHGEVQGLTAGAMAAALGLVEEVPFVNEMMHVASLREKDGAKKFFGELAKSSIVPAALDFVARQTDPKNPENINPAEHPLQYLNLPATKREAESVGAMIQSGIPGLRQDLPVRVTSALPEDSPIPEKIKSYMAQGGVMPAAPHKSTLEAKNGHIPEDKWERYVDIRAKAIQTGLLESMWELRRANEEEQHRIVGRISNKATALAKERLRLK